MSRNQIFIAVGVMVLIAVAAGAYFLRGSPAQIPATARSGAGYEIKPTDHVLGDPKAGVVLIEYAAPICPHCARFNEGVLAKIKKTYIDTGKIYYVFRVFPLSPYDGQAEKLARCMPADKYFSFIDLLFRSQPKWDPEYAAQNSALQTPEGVKAALVKMAGDAGMGTDRATHCIDDTVPDEQINAVAIDGQNRYNINSTPSFVLNGQPVIPPYLREWAYDDMAKVLDQALAAKP